MDRQSYVNTVLGELPCEHMGVTLSHEHLLMNPGDSTKYGDSIFDSPETIIDELTDFMLVGGQTIVEMTPLNFGRDVAGYREISEAIDLNVICCTGFHKEEFYPPWVYTKSDEEIVSLLLEEVNHGIGDTGIKPGVLKVGTSRDTITDAERRLIRIIAQVHKSSSLPISTHCDKGTMALEQCHLLADNEVDPSRVILGHVDIPNDVAYLKEICSLGFNVGIDHVGRDLDDGDATKIGMIRDLIDSGFRDQILLSGDMGKKSYLKVYGGEPGLAYIPHVLKRNMVERGIDAGDVVHILVANPQRVFCIGR